VVGLVGWLIACLAGGVGWLAGMYTGWGRQREIERDRGRERERDSDRQRQTKTETEGKRNRDKNGCTDKAPTEFLNKVIGHNASVKSLDKELGYSALIHDF